MNTWGLDADFCLARYGMVFFGTPHRGSNGVAVGVIASKIAQSILANPSNSLLESLREGSISTNILNEDFANQYERY